MSCRAIQFYEKNFLSADFETQVQARRIGGYYEKLSEKARLNFRLKKLRGLQQNPDILFSNDALTTSINQLKIERFLNFLPSLLPNGHRFIPAVLISKLVEEGLCLEISTPQSLDKFLEELLIYLNTLKLNHPALIDLIRYEVLTYQLKHLTEKKHYSAKDLNLSTLPSLKIFFPANVSWFHDQYDIISKLNAVADFNDFDAYQLLGCTKHYLVQYDFEAKKIKNFFIEGYGLKNLKAIKQSCNVSDLLDKGEAKDEQLVELINMLNELSCRKLVVFE